MKLLDCPSRETLQRLLNGRIARDQAEPLEKHLSECSRCVNAASQLKGDDDLIAAMRAADGICPLDDAAQRLVDSLKGMQAEFLNKPSDRLADAPSSELSFLSPAQSDTEVGRLGRYRVLEVLGSGGMGVVVKAFDPELGRDVAIKIIKAKVADGEEGAVRFMREARATAAITHDNVVTIYDVGTHNGRPYYTMELLQGEPLEARIARTGHLSIDECVRIACEIARGLAAAHERQLFHRDIKPGNIWLEASTDRVKILDFGLAGLGHNKDTVLTATGIVLGTPRYMSPEQALGQAVDFRTDLFSLGSVVYELVTGEAPFSRKSVSATVIAVVNDHHVDVQSRRPWCPSGLKVLVDRLLAKEPEGRYGSADDVVQVLQELAQGLAAAERTGVMPGASMTSGRIITAAVAVAIAFVVCLTTYFQDRGEVTFQTDPVTDKSDGRSLAKRDVRNSANSSNRAAVSTIWPDDAPRLAVAPFDADTARKHQLAWADYLGLPVERQLAEMKFVFIPPGEFLMGTTTKRVALALSQANNGRHRKNIELENPQRRVTITQPFYLCQHEVSQRAWNKWMGESSAWPKGPEYPVNFVSWEDVHLFVEELGQYEGAQGASFRLPTEAEWEYACRAGTTTEWHFGDSEGLLKDFACFVENSSLHKARRTPSPIGQLQPNPWMLFDTHGNVSEWCEDSFEPYPSHPETNPFRSVTNHKRVSRGGCWDNPSVLTRSAWRGASSQLHRDSRTGFRLVMEIQR